MSNNPFPIQPWERLLILKSILQSGGWITVNDLGFYLRGIVKEMKNGIR